MKTSILLFVSLSAAALVTAAGQSPTSDTASADLQKLLQEALFAEEATQDLPKAAANYEALLEAWAEQRRFAATALFRLAEVRRKQNRPQDAIAHYQQLLRDFPAEEPLARLSRENLLALGVEEGDLTAPPSNVVDDEESREIARLKELMAKSPDLLRAPTNAEGDELFVPPLHRAAANGQLRVMTFLLENGFPVDGGDAVGVSPLRVAAGAGQKAACELLLERGADINASNPLFAALKNGHLILAEYLLEKGADPDQFTSMPAPLDHGLVIYDWRPLHWAIWNSKDAVVDLLLENGADVNATLRAGVTPLHLAAQRNAVLKKLIDHGANVASATETAPFDPANQPSEKVTEGGWTALHFSVNHGHPDQVKLLLAAGAPVDALTENSGVTPLYIATVSTAGGEELKSEIIRLLLEHGASPNIAASDGRTPLHNVCNRGLQELAMLLLENGAEIDARTESGYTPLMTAATNNVSVEFLIALVKKGASLNAVQDEGKSALELANRATRVLLMRRFQYPQWVNEDGIKLCFPQILYTHTLATQASEQDRPPSLADVLLRWSDVPEEKIRDSETGWSKLQIFRQNPDGMIMVEISVTIDEPLPELEWGDVIEVTTSEQEENPERGGYSLVSWEIPQSVRTVLEAAQVRQVIVSMDGIEKELTLRGRLHIYNPLTDEAPLLPLGPLVRLLSGGSGKFINAGLVVHRLPENGGGTIETQLGWSEAEQLVLMEGDRIKVTPLPSSAQEKERLISLVSPGQLFGRSYPSAPIFEWEGYSEAPTLLQFLAWQYAPIPLHEVMGKKRSEEEQRHALQQWLADPAALGEAAIKSAALEPRAILPYPDWSRLVIRRLNNNLWEEMIPVDLEAAMRACSEAMTEEEARAFDIPLQFGDLVVLPVFEEHPDDPWVEFGPAAACLFEKALSRSVTFQYKNGDFRKANLRWIPPVYIQTAAGLAPIPREFPELGKVTVPIALNLVHSEGGPWHVVEQVIRGESEVTAREFAWLKDGDRVIASNPPPGTISRRPSRAVIMPPPLQP